MCPATCQERPGRARRRAQDQRAMSPHVTGADRTRQLANHERGPERCLSPARRQRQSTRQPCGAAYGIRTRDLRITRTPRHCSHRSTSTDSTPHSSQSTQRPGRTRFVSHSVSHGSWCRDLTQIAQFGRPWCPQNSSDGTTIHVQACIRERSAPSSASEAKDIRRLQT